ncbi:hypothetical protein JTB14_033481 [Gonioctena quinquepunctata]|nr:hypothetical protein JTB14_033481 [Gonioctena quinquepunctata]
MKPGKKQLIKIQVSQSTETYRIADKKEVNATKPKATAESQKRTEQQGVRGKVMPPIIAEGTLTLGKKYTAKLAYEKVANIEKGVSGFKTCGIFPVDPTKFSDSDFAPAENFNETSISLPSLTNIAQSKVQSSQPSISRQIEQTPRAQSPQPSTSRQIEQTPRAQSPQPSTSRQIEQTPRAQSPQRLTSRQSPVQTTPTKRVLSNISNIQTMKHVPIVLISPVPVPRGKTKKNPRPKQHSEILTSTPFKEVLDGKDRKKRIKMEKANAAKTNLRISSETKGNEMKSKNKMKGKQKKTPKIKVKNTKTKKRTREIISESDSDEESYDNDELCDDDELDDVSDAGETCSVCGDFGKDNEVWFRCTCCGIWSHKACTGTERPDNYICDFCPV